MMYLRRNSSWQQNIRRSPKHERTCHGHTFDSKAEMQRYQQLYALSLAKEITNLRVQVRYPLIIDGQREVLTDSKKQVAHYTPDFVYEKDGQEIIEDVKSKGTKRDRAAMLRIRVFEAIYCKEVRIIII